MRERIKKCTEVNQRKFFLRAEKPIAKKKKEQSARSKTQLQVAQPASVQSRPQQQFKSNLEILHKRKTREEQEAKVVSEVRKSLYGKHRLAKSIAKTLGL